MFVMICKQAKRALRRQGALGSVATKAVATSQGPDFRPTNYCQVGTKPQQSQIPTIFHENSKAFEHGQYHTKQDSRVIPA